MFSLISLITFEKRLMFPTNTNTLNYQIKKIFTARTLHFYKESMKKISEET